MGIASTAIKYFARSWEVRPDSTEPSIRINYLNPGSLYLQSSLQGKWFSYAYFLPNLACLQEVAALVEQGQVRDLSPSSGLW